jgi:hypothetical protein
MNGTYKERLLSNKKNKFSREVEKSPLEAMKKKDDYGFNLIGNMVNCQLKDSKAKELFNIDTHYFEVELERFGQLQQKDLSLVDFNGKKKY